MNQSFQQLRRMVLQAVEDQQQHPTPLSRRHERVLAEFLHRQLSKLTLNEPQVVQSLNRVQEQIEQLLQGLLIDETITEDVLQQLAEVLRCDLNVMRIILYGFDPKLPLTL